MPCQPWADEARTAIRMVGTERSEATSMLKSLRNFIASFAGNGRPRTFENRNCRLATAALLTRVATVDSDMSQARREKLRVLLQSHFELGDPAVAQLIRDATEAAGSAVDLYHFTRQLNDVLDNESRQCVVKMMWQVVYVDGRANDFESNIIWRIADLLGVSSRQRVELRQLVAAGGTTRSNLILSV
jgi:uncharacterized tellurite resistance protein B-like protein